MRFLPLVMVLALTACSSSTERAPEAPLTEEQAAEQTDQCLDNPELARSWGDCNVKHTLFLEADALAACRKNAPKAKSGVLQFELQVKADGKVRSAKAKSKSKFPKLEKCLVGVMKKLQFAAPPSGKEPVITVPYQLAP
jgi:hypothetical protein